MYDTSDVTKICILWINFRVRMSHGAQALDEPSLAADDEKSKRDKFFDDDKAIGSTLLFCTLCSPCSATSASAPRNGVLTVLLCV